MNLRDLHYFLAVARARHFGRAAENCHISQPALSSQIKKLEAELGVTLFERDNRNVRLTKAAEEIIPLAEEALAAIERIHSAASASKDPFTGDFRLGSIPTITPYLVPKLFECCRQKLPKLALEFTEDITERLTHKLIESEIDAAIIATPPEHNKLDAIPLYDEPFWVVFPPHHALKALHHIHTKDLPADELLLLSEGHCFRDQALDICRLDKAMKPQAIRASSLETLIKMVRAGQGITLVPALALDASWQNDPAIKSEKLDDANAQRRIYLAFRKTFPRQNLLERIGALITQDLPSAIIVRAR